MTKPLPSLRTDEEAEKFVAESDLTEYDLSGMRLVRFEFQPKRAGQLRFITARRGKAAAANAGMPYQRFIRRALKAADSTGLTGQPRSPLDMLIAARQRQTILPSSP